MIAWSIEAALASGLFDEVMVSTDDDEIAGLSRHCGASVPFLRSAENAGDMAATAAVLEEVLLTYAERGHRFDVACCVYPTAPFVTSTDLRLGLETLQNGPFDFVLPVTAFSFPIWRSLERGKDGATRMSFPQHRDARSQDLPIAYHDAGQWYWFRTAALLKERTVYGARLGSIVLPNTRVQDIDHEEDWTIAELKHGLSFPGAH
jgi:pseudaminic acid cytidylyltransferase